MTRSYWLDLFTGSSWEEFLAAGGMVSGFRNTRAATVKKIAQGDWLVCYVTGVSRWIGVFEVTGETFTSEEPIWKDDVFPVRLPVKVVLKLPPENAVPITLLRDKLSYFHHASPTAWTGHFRGSPARMKADDADAVVAALQAALSNPEDGPYSLSKWQHHVYTVTAPDEQEVTVPEDTEAASEPEAPTSTTHEEIQHLLVKLGNEMGFGVWLAKNDRGHKFGEQVLGEMPGVLASLPMQFDPATNKTIELIDVLWLKGNAIVAAFEVEHTTSVYSGLLRMADLVSMQPGITIRLYIVAPDARRDKVLGEIARPVFSRMEPALRERCQFIPYSELKQKEEQFHGMTQYLKPEFLDEIAESAG